MNAQAPRRPDLPLCIALLLCLLLAAPILGEVAWTVRPAMVDLRVAALLLSGQQGGDFPLAIFTYPLTPEARAVQVDLDGEALRQHLTAEALDLDVYLYALDAAESVITQTARRFTLTPADVPQDAQGVRLFDVLETKAKATTEIRALVMTADRKTFGLRKMTGLDADRSPPLIDAEEFWQIVAAPEVKTRWSESLSAPWSLDDTPKLPASRPVLVPKTPLQARFWPPAEPPDRAELTPSERSRPPHELALTPVDTGGSSAVSLRVPSLETGFYDLTFRWPDGTRGAPVTVFVLEAPPTARPAIEAAETMARPTETEPLDEAVVQTLAASYRDILRRLATDGTPDASIEALRLLEHDALTQLGDAAFLALERAESRFVSTLKKADWSDVWGVVWLQAEVVRAHRQAGDLALAIQANERTLRLARAYAQAVRTDDSRQRSGLLLFDLAAFFQDVGPLSRSAELYARALEIVPKEASLLLGQAVLHEKRGQHDAALAPLKRLTREHPEHVEGRLRLAINLQRAGQRTAARKRFESLIRQPDLPTWIGILAYQESARLERDAGRPLAAMARLEKALERWPETFNTRLQLAALAQAQGKRARTRQLLQTLDTLVENGLAPRHRYNRWAQPPAGTRYRLRVEVEARHDGLKRLLDAATPSAPEARP